MYNINSYLIKTFMYIYNIYDRNIYIYIYKYIYILSIYIICIIILIDILYIGKLKLFNKLYIVSNIYFIV